uniref:Uncharacterized protein n=1 Tax=Chromera velia CCMP2878 TaxID=1169474 RepID=A0A0G4FUJ1_9ALVE|eukprot:Cvel_18827.t1-p1 / transcript=Cvel_18827.t1 / gene=Cvel_18827 / organism=Chromera_velia_CCMP2878 / gene_product=hypothetical protein / transcript_product=hypothetical protein / location=Cvel_scaffold1581:42787-43519(+) / protein_length=68 / sequence_SO=supercontig / SO=protein_coding / is_pseudo=false
MSQSTATLQASVPAEVPQANSASRSAGREKEKKKEERKDNELCVIFDHARRTIEGRCRFPLGSLDLSG